MNDSRYRRRDYMVQGLPAGVFGESYVIVTAVEVTPGQFRS